MIGAGEVVGGDRKYIHCTRISNSNEQEMTGITPRLGLHNLVLKPSNDAIRSSMANCLLHQGSQ